MRKYAHAAMHTMLAKATTITIFKKMAIILLYVFHGPVEMSKSYPGSRENISRFSTSKIILFCSYGEKLSRLTEKVFGRDERNNERKKVMVILCSYCTKQK
jgi:hypothetical protein